MLGDVFNICMSANSRNLGTNYTTENLRWTTFSYTFRMYFPIGNVWDFPAIRHVSFQGTYLFRSKCSDSSPWCTPARKGNAPHGAEPSSVRLIDEKGLFLEYPPRNLLGGYVQITQKGIFRIWWYDGIFSQFLLENFRNFGLQKTRYQVIQIDDGVSPPLYAL